jgi:hypothetical protein
MDVERAYRRRRRGQQVAPRDEPPAVVDALPADRLPAALQQRRHDAGSHGVDDGPGVHPFAAHAITESRLALDDQHARARLGHRFSRRRPGEPAAYDDQVVPHRDDLATATTRTMRLLVPLRSRCRQCQ